MKTKLIQQTCLSITLGLALLIPILVHAGGNTGQRIAKFEPIKSDQQLEQLKPGDTIVKVCLACHRVTMVRIDTPGQKGTYDYVPKKCEDCGSENTYLAVSKQEIPFKERIKR
ncbi:MAG: hypothetical protein WDM76_08250 [Limisphaerales bacterium]